MSLSAQAVSGRASASARVLPRSLHLVSLRSCVLFLVACAALAATIGVGRQMLAVSSSRARAMQMGGALSSYLDVNSPWPKFCGNLQNTSQGVGAGANGLEKWRFQTGNVILGSPVVGSNGHVYFGSDDGCVYALDSNGNYLWSYQTGSIVRSTPLLGPNTVFVGSYDNNLYALDSSTGQLKWSFVTPAVTVGASAPTMGPNGLLYLSSHYELYAINSVTGALVWSVEEDGQDTPPAVDSVHGTVYIG